MTGQRHKVWTVRLNHNSIKPDNFDKLCKGMAQFFGIRIGHLPGDADFKAQIDLRFGFLDAATKAMRNPALGEFLCF